MAATDVTKRAPWTVPAVRTTRRLSRREVFAASAGIVSLTVTACRGGSVTALPTAVDSASYFPHWVSRDGRISDAMLDQLEPGSIIGMHHAATLSDLQRILDHPEKAFRIAWYAESNVDEADDSAVGAALAARIEQATIRRRALMSGYGADRVLDLIEIDGARDKADGYLREDQPSWLDDAKAVYDAGMRYLAKNLHMTHVGSLRSRFGKAFVPRLVFEDVTAAPGATNTGFRHDAREAVRHGEIVTLIIHEGEYGDFPGTPLDTAKAVVSADFDSPNAEAYWGRTSSLNGFVKLKGFSKRLHETG